MEVKPIKCFLLDHGYSTLTSAPCCDTQLGSPCVTSFSELHSNPRYLEIKQSMDQGVWHKACDYCRVVEERNDNVKSKRQMSLTKFDNTIEKDTLVELQLAPGYLCNIQCRSCTPYLSSSWVSEYRSMPVVILAAQKNPFPNDITQVYPPALYDYANDDWSTIKYVDFVGGEPIYNNEFYVQLKKLVDETGGESVVSFSTNGTIVMDFKKHPWIAKFKEMHICVSVDSVGPSAEFIRTGTNWNKVEQTIQFYKLMPQFKNHISYHLTNSVLNILETDNTLTYLESLGVPRTNLTIHVSDPVYLSYSVLTHDEKIEIIKQIQDTRAEYVIPALNDCSYNPDHRSQFLLFMEHTKNYHGMDWKDYVPALYKIMNQQNK